MPYSLLMSGLGKGEEISTCVILLSGSRLASSFTSWTGSVQVLTNMIAVSFLLISTVIASTVAADNARPGLFRRFRFCAQQPVHSQRVDNLGVALRPRVVDHYAFETPFVAVACEFAIVAIHQ